MVSSSVPREWSSHTTAVVDITSPAAIFIEQAVTTKTETCAQNIRHDSHGCHDMSSHPQEARTCLVRNLVAHLKVRRGKMEHARELTRGRSAEAAHDGPLSRTGAPSTRAARTGGALMMLCRCTQRRSDASNCTTARCVANHHAHKDSSSHGRRWKMSRKSSLPACERTHACTHARTRTSAHARRRAR